MFFKLNIAHLNIIQNIIQIVNGYSDHTYENLTFTVILIFFVLILFHFYRRRIRKKLENNFIVQSNELQKEKEKAEAAEKSATLEHLKLVESNKIKSDLFSILAHDLKSPLISIKMLSKIIIEESPKQSAISDYAADIFSTAQRVHNLIEEILDSAILESGILVLDKKQVDVGKLAELVVLDNSIAAKQKDQKIIFQQEAGCTVEGDELRIRSVIDNLLSNAIKYSQVGKGIWLSISKLDNLVNIELKDEGVGFTEDDLKKIFGKFQRLSAQPTGGEPSSGLGLSIVKQLVEMHHGTIEVKSDSGNGTIFIVKLPLKER
ncbi:MAG: HAMP domain-containing histidine kinase [Ignavibacteriales bacterium]|nr:HAMP domain-containing histidine kinase [Ignavibacteriales bacterium]